MPEVIVVGDIDTDIFHVVPHLPTWDEGVVVEESYQRPGGKGGNTAAALSRLGIPTGIIAAAGDDIYGKVALDGLKTAGVDVHGVTIVPGGQTYYCIMMLDETGEKAILVIHTDLTYPSEQMIQAHAEFLSTAFHVHFIGLDAQLMAGPMKMAKEAGLTVSVDLDACYQGWKGFEAISKYCDLVFINRQGAERLYGSLEPHEVVRDMLRHGPSVAVVTLGKDGAAAGDGRVYTEVPAFRMKVKDTTGAGDVFAGAFLRGFVRAWDMDKSLRFATAAAALSTLAVGGQSAIPGEEEVWQFLKDNE